MLLDYNIKSNIMFFIKDKNNLIHVRKLIEALKSNNALIIINFE